MSELVTREQVPLASSTRKSGRKMQNNCNMGSKYIPIIALTAAAVGWVLVAWERRTNAKLRRRLRELEAAATHK